MRKLSVVRKCIVHRSIAWSIVWKKIRMMDHTYSNSGLNNCTVSVTNQLQSNNTASFSVSSNNRWTQYSDSSWGFSHRYFDFLLLSRIYTYVDYELKNLSSPYENMYSVWIWSCETINFIHFVQYLWFDWVKFSKNVIIISN